MKANKAPERIWINSPQDLPCGIVDSNSVEYTRTDVFIEKALKWLKEHAEDYNYTWYNEFSGESGITDKCIDDFKKYMKEE